MGMRQYTVPIYEGQWVQVCQQMKRRTSIIMAGPAGLLVASTTNAVPFNVAFGSLSQETSTGASGITVVSTPACIQFNATGSQSGQQLEFDKLTTGELCTYGWWVYLVPGSYYPSYWTNFVEYFNSSTLVIPPGCTSFECLCIGSGGWGASGNGTLGGGGGGGGGVSWCQAIQCYPGQVFSVIVGYPWRANAGEPGLQTAVYQLGGQVTTSQYSCAANPGQGGDGLGPGLGGLGGGVPGSCGDDMQPGGHGGNSGYASGGSQFGGGGGGGSGSLGIPGVDGSDGALGGGGGTPGQGGVNGGGSGGGLGAPNGDIGQQGNADGGGAGGSSSEYGFDIPGYPGYVSVTMNTPLIPEPLILTVIEVWDDITECEAAEESDTGSLTIQYNQPKMSQSSMLKLSNLIAQLKAKGGVDVSP